jgi:hypothetical protein
MNSSRSKGQKSQAQGEKCGKHRSRCVKRVKRKYRGGREGREGKKNVEKGRAI